MPPGGREPKGVRVTRTRLRPDEIAIVRGVPATTVARTLLDIGSVDIRLVEPMIRQADFLGSFDLAEVVTLLERYPRRHGTARLRTLIRAFSDSDVRTRSELEDAFRAIVATGRLPTPEFNAVVELDGLTIEADAVWPEARLIVELDGRQAHATRHAFETDRARDRAATLAGWAVIRVTWRHLNSDRRRLLSDLRQLISARHRH